MTYDPLVGDGTDYRRRARGAAHICRDTKSFHPLIQYSSRTCALLLIDIDRASISKHQPGMACDSPSRRRSAKHEYDSDHIGPPPRPRQPQEAPPPYDSPNDSSDRRSILKGSSVTPKRQARVRDPSPVESVVGEYVRHRDGKVDFKPPRPRGVRKPQELEARDNIGAPPVHSRRDGYESDEGPPKRGGKQGRRSRGDVLDGYDLPERPRNRSMSEYAGPAAVGAVAGAATGYPGARRSRRPPPESRRQRYDDPEDDYPARGARRPRNPPDPYDDRGYASDRPRRASRWDPDDDVTYADLAPRRCPPRARYEEDDYYDDRRAPPMRSRSIQEADPRLAGGRPGGKEDWKQQGIGLFKAHAMPVIRQEGGRFVRKELGKFLAERAGR